MFDNFQNANGTSVPIVLHQIACPDHMSDLDPSGQYLKRMYSINNVFEKLAVKHQNIGLFISKSFFTKTR